MPCGTPDNTRHVRLPLNADTHLCLSVSSLSLCVCVCVCRYGFDELLWRYYGYEGYGPMFIHSVDMAFKIVGIGLVTAGKNTSPARRMVLLSICLSFCLCVVVCLYGCVG